MNRKQIDEILKKTEEGYDLISEKFSQTRTFFWGDLSFIADRITDGDRVLDYGCGNGRLLEILKSKKVDYVGLDVSQKLIDLAKARYPEHKEAFQKITSQASLAFPDNYFNKIISIAVFHHFPENYAREMARELNRVTKPGGAVIVTAWNLWQKKRRKHIFNLPAIIGKIFQIGPYSGFGFNDVLVPFRDNQGKVFRRYHRAYTEKSLAEVFLSAGFGIEKCFLEKEKNIILIAKKK